MKKSGLFFVILSFLVLSLAGISYGWQGRMAGMGDPYGLVQDESDFLFHPAGIANGKGINFYGNYRFNYRDITDWNYTLDWLDPGTGALFDHMPFKTSGDEWEHEGLLGTAFPLGSGRMGLFFQYSGKRGDLNGKENQSNLFGNFYHKYSLESDLDSFALRLLYGLPVGGFKLGGEIQLAYRQEENETFFNEDLGGGLRGLYTNFLWSILWPGNLYPFMFPFDSKYWEALLKGSLEGAIGLAKVSFTMQGGFIFGGDNKLNSKMTVPGPMMSNLDGDVKGWNIGGNLWLRYPLAKDLSLPFLLKIGYQRKTRDGDGPLINGMGPENFDYKNNEKIFQLEVGGGLDKELPKGTRIATGIYYGFLQNKVDYLLFDSAPGSWTFYNHSKYPETTEHKIMLRVIGEKELSPSFIMRMGLNFFYGWVKEDFNLSYIDSISTTDIGKISSDGSHWGIGASLGGTAKFDRFSVEPFIAGGYQKLNLDGDGFRDGFPPHPTRLEMDKLRKEWSIGGGFSIKFN